jgi:toxin ParE1/3/4
MAFPVHLTEDAALDLEEICDHFDRNDMADRTAQVLDHVEEVLSVLSTHPHMGNYPPELSNLGIHDCRETRTGPYRVIYRVMNGSVYVLLIADGRRDMQTLLQRRLLRTRR